MKIAPYVYRNHKCIFRYLFSEARNLYKRHSDQTSMIESVGLSRSEMSIIDIVKYTETKIRYTVTINGNLHGFMFIFAKRK